MSCASPRIYILLVDESDIEKFIEGQTNKKNSIENNSGSKKFKSQTNKNESREIYETPPVELLSLLCRIFMSVPKATDEDYERSSLRGMMASFDRQLRRHNYEQFISTGDSFAQLREVLKCRQKQFKREGKGGMPNKSDAISPEEVDILWITGQMGGGTPDSILQTLCFYTRVHVGLQGCAEHREMCWGDIVLKSDENGHGFLEFTERQTKTRTDEDIRNVRAIKPKLWANIDNPGKCPSNVYKKYAEKRPYNYSNPDHPFYIASTTKPLPSESETWFKRNPVGINKL